MYSFGSKIFLLFTCGATMPNLAWSLNGGRSMVSTSNGWKSLEVITEGDETGNENGSRWRMPNLMDGMGAFLADGGKTIRIQVNHERDSDATISEVNMNKNLVKKVIARMIHKNDDGDIKFVETARRAFDRWTSDGDREADDMRWRTGSDFCRFCSSQSYDANTFGTNRGFVDRLYITGEECEGGRLFVLQSDTKDLYQVSGVTGKWQGGSGHGGMPFDSFENAALIDTGDTKHIALLLSADGGTETLRLYIGKKGVDANGDQASSNNFLARNGLLYGEWFYLGNLSDGSRSWSGRFVNDHSSAMKAEKFEDIDTNPNNPKQVVLAESYTGVYILDFDLVIHNEMGFQKQDSKFAIRQITDSGSRSYQYPDNVDWTRNNLIFVNKDHEEGGIWYMKPSGDGKTQVGKTVPDAESTGILDLSNLLDLPPASVMITTNQGSPSSMTLLLNPDLKNEIQLEDDDEEELEQEETDQDNNESENDTQGQCPVTSTNEKQIFEAEDAILFDAIVETRENNYCGDGYVDFGEFSESAGVIFVVDTDTAGTYKVSIRYANGGGSKSDRPGYLFVDDVDQQSDLVFAATDSWSNWKIESKNVDLDEGRHNIEVWWGPEKRPNIDLMYIEKIN